MIKIVNAVMMIVSTSVGMGILGLPIVTASSGFFPTLVSFGIAWVFMTIAAHYILEIKMTLRGHYSLAGMIKLTLGKSGHFFASWVILLLLYALLSTYLMAAIAWLKLIIPSFSAYSELTLALLFTLFFVIVMICREQWLYQVNNILGMGVLLAFIGTIGSSLMPAHPHFMQQINLKEILPSFPLLLTTFGFSIVVPAITEYLNYDEQAAKKSVLWGSLIALLAYAVWEWVTLGNIPLSGEVSFASLKVLGDNGTGVITALATLSHHSWVIFLGKLFALLLVITSFLGISLALIHFLSDLLHYPLKSYRRTVLSAFMYLPPIIVIAFFPRAFVQFLSFAGIFVAVLLGLFPAFMILKLRQKTSPIQLNSVSLFHHPFAISLVSTFFILIIIQEMMNLNLL